MAATPGSPALRAARDLLLQHRADHDAAVSSFVWPDVGGTFNWAVDWFDGFARGNQGEAIRVLEEDGSRVSRSFDEMATTSDRVAAWLHRVGVRRGDAVLLMLDNQVELWEAMLGITKLGAVVLPTTTAVGTADLLDRIARGRVRHVIARGADAGKFDDVPGDHTRIRVGAGPDGWLDFADASALEAPPAPHPGTAAGDPLLLYFTSGTTSRPKLVEHTQVSYPVGHLSTMYWLGLQPGAVHLAVSSPGWAKHAWSCFFAPWLAEATVFVYNYGRFDPTTMLQRLREERVTSFCAPPTVWRMLIKADLSGGRGALTELISAGEPLNPEVIEQVRRQWGLTIRDGFGQTETTAIVGNTPGSPVRPGAMGRPLPGCPVVLVDPLTGAPGAEGEVCIDLAERPTNLMTGYVGENGGPNELTASATRGGYYHTGDLAVQDEDGSIRYVGRVDDVFKASDYKISPFELESVLVEHPAVLESAVVPAPDELRLAVPKAYVTLAAGWEPDAATAEQILRYARERLAPYLRVRRIEFAVLPKTISGKIRRVELRLREARIADGGLEVQEWRDDQFPALASVRQRDGTTGSGLDAAEPPRSRSGQTGQE